MAQTMVPEIEAWDQAPEGSVERLDEFKLTDFLPTDAILCRVNAPNIRLNYRLIGVGIPCRMKGRDIGAGMITLVKKLCGKAKQQPTLDELLERCDQYQIRAVVNWTRRPCGQTEQRRRW
jgi:hypothetical protein